MGRYVVVRAAIAIAVALMFASPTLAQSSQANPNAQKPKKQVNQVPETGPNDPDPDPNPGAFDRAFDNVKVTVRADGTVVAELDDSFMEASTVSIAADGSLQFEHFIGLDRAEAAVRRHASEAAVLPLLPARPWPLWTPIFEKQE
jgi:hypothetical protein